MHPRYLFVDLDDIDADDLRLDDWTLILFTKYQTFAVALATHFAVIDKSQLILR